MLNIHTALDAISIDNEAKRTKATGNLRNAKLRKGNLRDRLRNALWLVGQN